MKKSILLRNLGWQTTYQVISNVLGFLFTIILARQVSVFYFGVYSYIISVMYIASLFLELGIPNYFFRKWSTERQRVIEEMRLFLGTRILLAIPVSIILFGYVFLVDRFVSFEFVLLYLYFILEAPLQVNRIFFSSKNDFHLTALIDVVDKVLSSGGGILALLLGASLAQVLLLFVLVRVLTVVLSVVLVKIFPIPHFSISSAWEVIRRASPLFVLSVFSILYFRIDMMIIRFFLGIPAVGLYSAAYRLLEAAIILPNLLLLVFIPELTQLFAAREQAVIQNISKRLFLLLGVFSFLFLVMTSLYSQEILALLYNGRYSEASPVLVILGWTVPLLFLTIPVSHLLFASHNEKYQTKILAGLTVMNVLLNILFVPIFGILGAALTTLFGEFLGLILLYRKIHLPVDSLSPLIKIIVLSACVFFGGFFLPLPWILEAFLLVTLYLLGIISMFWLEMREYANSIFGK